MILFKLLAILIAVNPHAPQATCVVSGASCTTSSDCCGQLECVNNECMVTPLPTCAVTGDECSSGTCCLSGACKKGKCACRKGDQTCLTDSDCCWKRTNACTGGRCRCKEDGKTCTANHECCPGLICGEYVGRHTCCVSGMGWCNQES